MGAKEASKQGVSHLNWVWEEMGDLWGGSLFGDELEEIDQHLLPMIWSQVGTLGHW